LHDIVQALFHAGELASFHAGVISCLPVVVPAGQKDFRLFCLPACTLGGFLAIMPSR
jgi:hypothetical protein